ncbi:uncharacterized protein [Ambystoma mexicanum]|uniref:uncharacterized protein n=1 Tax=Ambystoma mexicanum TaxID=8296 RepID=UPI0037E8DA9B
MDEERCGRRHHGSASPTHSTFYDYTSEGVAVRASTNTASYQPPYGDARTTGADVVAQRTRDRCNTSKPSWCRLRVEFQHQQDELAASQKATDMSWAYGFPFQGNWGDSSLGLNPNANKLDSFSDAFPNKTFVRQSQEDQSWDTDNCQLQLFCPKRALYTDTMALDDHVTTYGSRTNLGSPHSGAWQQHPQVIYMQETRRGPQHKLLPSDIREIVEEQRVHHKMNFQHSHPLSHMPPDTQYHPSMPYTSLPTHEARGYGQFLEEDTTGLSRLVKASHPALKAEPAECLYQDSQPYAHVMQELNSGGNTGQEEYLGMEAQAVPSLWKDLTVPFLISDSHVLETAREASPASTFGGHIQTEPVIAYHAREPNDHEPGWGGTNGALWHEVSPCPLTSYYTGIPFSSCLRLMKSQVDCSTRGLKYTPCPMLNPLRRGTGLFANLLSDLWDISLPVSPPTDSLALAPGYQCNQFEEAAHLYGAAVPQINLGPEYQAELPELQDPFTTTRRSLPEEVVWRPQQELEWDANLQHRVDTLLNVACSSAFPGGGSNQELALHHLSEAGGDVMAALERLLLKDPKWPKSHPLADYHYTGSDVWKPQERRLFNRAFALHRKDFLSIHKMQVRTRGLQQCVEYYYLRKKSLLLQQKRSSHYEEDRGGQVEQDKVFSCPVLTDSCLQREPLLTASCASVKGSFPCKQCGKMFYKIKSRNAHMKIHRPQDWKGSAQRPLPPADVPEPDLLDEDYSQWNSGGLQTFELTDEALDHSNVIPQYADNIKLNCTGRLFS